MKKNSAILHISDLHIVDFKPKNDKVQLSYVDDSDDFINNLIDSIQTECSENKSSIEYIFVTGDIANAGKKQEYDKATDFLNKLTTGLNIPKDKVKLVPGNHDINWTDIDGYIEERDFQDESYKLHEIKFKKFKNFFDGFYENDSAKFKEDSPVVDFYVDNDNKVLILSLNSVFYESSSSEYHFGCINHKELRKYLEDEFKDEYKSYGKLVLLHHHESAFLNNDTYNWSKVETILNKYNFNVFIHGHLHDDDSESRDDGALNYYFGVSSLAKKDSGIENSYNLFFNKNSENEFEVTTLHFSKNSTKKNYWQPQTRIKAKRHFSILSMSLDFNNSSTGEEKIVAIERYNPREVGNKYSFSEYSFKETDNLKYFKKRIINYIRERKLFKTGHFHWTESFRSHGLIDIFGLISNNEIQSLIISSFIELIKSKDIKVENMVGVGFEGNIIGSFLSMQFPWSNYSYIPNSNEYFNEFEKKTILGKNTITIIEDVIFQADSLTKLLNDNSENIKNIKQIDLITLFFCGNEKDLTNISKIPKLNFHYIFNEISIEGCPHKIIENCPIVVNNLDNYYNFY